VLEPTGALATSDRFAGGQVLADQNGAGAALTFMFASEVQLTWVRCDGGNGRADPFGGTPTATLGIICEDGIPNPLTVSTTSVKVFANIGTSVNVWGYRY
jgi:hypothetical protein